MLLVKTEPPSALQRGVRWPQLVFLLGVAAVLLPTMYDVARLTWTTEQGGHAPIIVATGAWLLWRELQSTSVRARPGNLRIGAFVLAVSLALYFVARVTGILEIEGVTMYASVLAACYLLVGGPLMRAMWFPIVYLAVALPPPDTLVSLITQPMKIGISQAVVSLLHTLGYPIASSGVTIQISNYELLVAAACAGLNSIITLSAICLFYVYLRHRSDLKSFLLVGLLILPVAIFSNFIRVMALVLITYYLGEAAAQGFLHDFAGLTVFLVALITIIAVDSLFTRFRTHRKAHA